MVSGTLPRANCYILILSFSTATQLRSGTRAIIGTVCAIFRFALFARLHS